MDERSVYPAYHYGRNYQPAKVSWRIAVASSDTYDNLNINDFLERVAEARDKMTADNVPLDAISVRISATMEPDYGGDRAVAEMLLVGQRDATDAEAAAEERRRQAGRDAEKRREAEWLRKRLAEVEES